MFILVVSCPFPNQPILQIPSVSITAPIANEFVFNSVSVIASVDSNAEVQEVEFFVDNLSQKKLTAKPFQTTLDISGLIPGQHQISVVARNGAGASTPKTVSVRVPSKPSIVITQPILNTGIFGDIKIAAKIMSETSFGEVQLFVDKNLKGILAAPGYDFTLKSSELTLGEHQINVRTSNMAGDSQSETVAFKLRGDVQLVAPNNANGNLDFVANVRSEVPVKNVSFYRDGSQLLGTRVAPPYVISIHSEYLPNSTYPMMALVETTAGVFSSQTVQVNIQNTHNCTPVTAPTLSGFSPFEAVIPSLEITVGPYVGAYVQVANPAVNSGVRKLNWYFAAIAMHAFADRNPTKAKTFVESYLKHVNQDLTIKDVEFQVKSDSSVDYNVIANTPPSDSDDSYAASILTLVRRIYQVTCDKNWVLPKLEVLKAMARRNLLEATLTNGLINNRQRTNINGAPNNSPLVVYTQDNAENYRGLTDFAALLADLDDSTSGLYVVAAAKIAKATQEILFSSITDWATNCSDHSPNLAGFSWGWTNIFPSKGDCLFGVGGRMYIYPDGVTQIFPEVFQMDVPQEQKNAGWLLLRDQFSKFDLSDPSGFPQYLAPTDPYTRPWAILGYAAALRGETTIANNMIQLMDGTYTKDAPRISIQEWAFYERTKRLVQDPNSKPY